MDGVQLEGVLKNWLAKDEPDASEDYKEDCYNDFIYSEADHLLKTPQTIQANVVTVELVASEFGGENKFPADGGEVYIVLKVDTDGHVQYFKLSGLYQSFEGTTWNGSWREVTPREKKVTVFE